MKLQKNHISFDQCIDILEVGLGDHETTESYTGTQLVDAIRTSIAVLNFLKEHTDSKGHVEGDIYEEEWNYNIKDVPLETPIKLLLRHDLVPLYPIECVGTMVNNDGIFPTHGKCIEGNPEEFYRSIILAWKPLEEKHAKIS